MEDVIINKGFTTITISDIQDGIFTIQIETEEGGKFKKSRQEAVIDIKNDFIAIGNSSKILLTLMSQKKGRSADE